MNFNTEQGILFAMNMRMATFAAHHILSSYDLNLGEPREQLEALNDVLCGLSNLRSDYVFLDFVKGSKCLLEQLLNFYGQYLETETKFASWGYPNERQREMNDIMQNLVIRSIPYSSIQKTLPNSLHNALTFLLNRFGSQLHQNELLRCIFVAFLKHGCNPNHFVPNYNLLLAFVPNQTLFETMMAHEAVNVHGGGSLLHQIARKPELAHHLEVLFLNGRSGLQYDLNIKYEGLLPEELAKSESKMFQVIQSMRLCYDMDLLPFICSVTGLNLDIVETVVQYIQC